MGLLDRFSKKIRFPHFPVAVYGKLPCHKEYLAAGSGQLFGALKRVLDTGFERRISDRQPPPHVLPDRRFYLSEGRGEDLLGCVFESNDGQRHFPFVMAATIPNRLVRKPFPVAWQICAHIWDYLERYYADLREQTDAAAVYARVRGVVHAPEPLEPAAWPEYGESLQPEQLASGMRRLEIDRDQPTAPRLALSGLPRWLLWPCGCWQSQIDVEGEAFLGPRGLDDVAVDQFRQDAVAAEWVEDDLDDTIPDEPDEDEHPSAEPEEEGEPEAPPMFIPPSPLGRDREER